MYGAGLFDLGRITQVHGQLRMGYFGLGELTSCCVGRGAHGWDVQGITHPAQLNGRKLGWRVPNLSISKIEEAPWCQTLVTYCCTVVVVILLAITHTGMNKKSPNASV